ncbi:Long-chain acyl-CoA thioesterase FadM [Andreprevotia sp. IGB-42]|uniref:acyl-CoA thioesterase n=1 Tax=Andreprevotia sp. IGB-42 TaxID=2497473 RepID=UPI001359B38C|nr:acyl-CoA thioesterase [Andreprevotia sp. IGB-42]KAF0811823.1 Long-chain acyl-CoA thioesterase FadM [Andreprevotia sp. IGB-42]
MLHKTEIKVRGYHLDLYGHVNNARYLEFLEEARWGLLEDASDIGWFMQQQLALVVTRIDIRYKRPATMGDVLVIETQLAQLEERAAIVTQRIVRADNGKLVAEADVTLAVVHPDTAGALVIEGELASRLGAMKGAE